MPRHHRSNWRQVPCARCLGGGRGSGPISLVPVGAGSGGGCGGLLGEDPVRERPGARLQFPYDRGRRGSRTLIGQVAARKCFSAPSSPNLTKFVPNAEKVSLDCGNWIQQEMPKRSNQAIVRWLEYRVVTDPI